jgi:hypothetical protein
MVVHEDRAGSAEIVWRHRTSAQLALALMNGSICRRRMGAGWSIAGADELNGDRTADLPWHYPSTDQIAFWFSQRDERDRDIGVRWRASGRNATAAVTLPFSAARNGPT